MLLENNRNLIQSSYKAQIIPNHNIPNHNIPNPTINPLINIKEIGDINENICLIKIMSNPNQQLLPIDLPT